MPERSRDTRHLILEFFVGGKQPETNQTRLKTKMKNLLPLISDPRPCDTHQGDGSSVILLGAVLSMPLGAWDTLETVEGNSSHLEIRYVGGSYVSIFTRLQDKWEFQDRA